MSVSLHLDTHGEEEANGFHTASEGRKRTGELHFILGRDKINRRF